MRIHLQHSGIALPESLEDLYVDTGGSGHLKLHGRFNSFSGAIIKTADLTRLAENFDYEQHGYGALLSGPGMPERTPFAIYKKGALGEVLQGAVILTEPELQTGKLDPDLEHYKSGWQDLFNRFAKIVSPMMGDVFEVRLKCLHYSEEWFHQDTEVVGILPLGAGRRSTVCRAEDGIDAIRPDNGEFVVTTPALEHSSPVSDMPRAGLAVTKYLTRMP